MSKAAEEIPVDSPALTTLRRGVDPLLERLERRHRDRRDIPPPLPRPDPPRSPRQARSRHTLEEIERLARARGLRVRVEGADGSEADQGYTLRRSYNRPTDYRAVSLDVIADGIAVLSVHWSAPQAWPTPVSPRPRGGHSKYER